VVASGSPDGEAERVTRQQAWRRAEPNQSRTQPDGKHQGEGAQAYPAQPHVADAATEGA
jgi:hypothetical protein